MSRTTGLALYDGTARVAAAPVIRRYSTSFRLATSLFPRRCRAAIASIYALVRIADEIVDGTAAEAGLDRAARGAVLDELERETERAVATGFSANLVVHAFAAVAREAGIESALTRAFFASMRRDLDDVAFDETEYRTYVHGSAEVVGLMCLRVFLAGRPVAPEVAPRLDEGAARLGAAFQKVNFLRDVAHDRGYLGRSYLPGVAASGMTDEQKTAVVDDIRADLRAARAAVRHLPGDCRRPVLVATALFGELLRRLERTPASRLASTRVSVPAPVKLALALRWTLAPSLSTGALS
ncbi:MAG: phytoene synthase [Microbacterium sp. 14-71-5]|jgi:phytoene/squalene synthetase|nr:MAG: phytoene synthase [Microbacterium sp. 14-71-5]